MTYIYAFITIYIYIHTAIPNTSSSLKNNHVQFLVSRKQGADNGGTNNRDAYNECLSTMRHPYGVVKRAGYSTAVPTTEAPTTEVPTRDAWKQMSSSSCRNDQGQRYESFSAAQGSCVLGSQCDGVYDANCDGSYYPCTSA